jgi:hypothetical protein
LDRGLRIQGTRWFIGQNNRGVIDHCPSAFVISRSSIRIRKAAPKREITDATMASVFICLFKTKNEQISMDHFGKERPFSISFLIIWGENKRKARLKAALSLNGV